MINSAKIVCLCGSTKFQDEFNEINKDFSLKGYIVLSVGCFTHSDPNITITPEQKELLDELHKRKIDICDLVYVINVKGYIGTSTQSEIEYATKLGKEIQYLE